MQIGDLSQQVDVSRQTIRYYERIGLLPEPERAANGYRIYTQDDVECLRFIRSIRALSFSLDNIQAILDLRDRGTAPCTHVMGLIREKVSAVDDRIRELERLRAELTRLHQAALQMSEDMPMKNRVCDLIKSLDDTRGPT